MLMLSEPVELLFSARCSACFVSSSVMVTCAFSLLDSSVAAA